MAIVTLTVCWGQATLSKSATVDRRRSPERASAAARRKPAEYIGEARCIECHGQENKHFSETLHAKVFRLNPKNDRQRQGCEACHGPGSDHARNATRQDRADRVHQALGHAGGRAECASA